MNPKPHPNHRIYLEVLRKMTPAQRLEKTMELSELTKTLFLHGLRKRFPQKTEGEVKEIYLQRLLKCHNRSY